MVQLKSAKWKEGYRSRVKAPVALVEVEKIREKEGSVTPAALVKSAKPKRSPIHDAFEWSDTKAAARYREWEARKLLGALVVVTLTDTTERRIQPAYVSVQLTAESPDRGYVRTVDALADDDLRARALKDALKALAGLRRRYQQLEELVKFLDNIEGDLEMLLTG
jgi:hypothetical protein